MKYYLMIISLLVSSCSMDDLFFWEDDEPVATDGENTTHAAPPVVEKKDEEDEKKSVADPKDLKLTKLFARIEQLEAQVRRQREDFHVLRKGLMTGLIPSHWQDDLPKYSDSYQSDKPRSPKMKSEALSVILGEGESSGARGYAELNDKDRRRYEQKLAKASHYFKSGDYGKAILAYTEIGRDYGAIARGSHLLWMGASWYRLKDYQASRKHLTSLIKGYSTSPWVPEAKFMLAKTDFREGFTERSLETLKDIIRSYPDDNIADRAKEELKRVESSL